MKKSSKKKITRKDIIGLGEASFKKNYYPELQEKLLELEKINSRNISLIRGIPDIILYYNEESFITEYNLEKDQRIIEKLLNNRKIISELLMDCKWVKAKEKPKEMYFSMIVDNNKRYYEARVYLTQIKEVFVIIRDNTEMLNLQRKLKRQALTDPLTGLYNRRYFEDQLNKYNSQMLPGFSLIIFDIDGLKVINDTLGHLSGDKMIIAAANLITDHFSDATHIARIGGDEFGIIYKQVDYTFIQEHLSKFEKTLAAFNNLNEVYKISLSFGYSINREGDLDINYLYKTADNKMYQRKLLKESSIRNNFVKTLMKALEEKDFITEGHAQRMGISAVNIGKELNLSINVLNRLELLSKFHDIGKVGVPDEILKKPGPLNEKEWEIMKTHCEIGFRIANESSELREIAGLILKHQEKYDGTGYPLGLSKDEIPIECRIISVVDAFDAMTNDRPYRKGMSIKAAVDELNDKAGTQFDPFIVRIFTNILKFKNYY